MKQTITEYEFVRAFNKMDRENNFSIEGRRALFEYLEGIDENMELDVISIYCDYSEYKNIKEYLEDYPSDIDRKDFEGEDDLEGYEEAVMKEIEEKTTVIKINDSERFIIQQF